MSVCVASAGNGHKAVASRLLLGKNDVTAAVPAPATSVSSAEGLRALLQPCPHTPTAVFGVVGRLEAQLRNPDDKPCMLIVDVIFDVAMNSAFEEVVALARLLRALHEARERLLRSAAPAATPSTVTAVRARALERVQHEFLAPASDNPQRAIANVTLLGTLARFGLLLPAIVDAVCVELTRPRTQGTAAAPVEQRAEAAAILLRATGSSVRAQLPRARAALPTAAADPTVPQRAAAALAVAAATLNNG
eukprot:TRINITY_DN8781_c0_g1_i2.p1 TRINITY_DN8781_c0_g1~~TRINITY_DN8781_c0_g1_i2.p1  ORF type:complete len:249 (-),score=29.34 TRINITY_DN8781_c0_g1_i2:115-861(-)